MGNYIEVGEFRSVRSRTGIKSVEVLVEQKHKGKLLRKSKVNRTQPFTMKKRK